MSSTHTNEKWLREDHHLRPALEGIIRDDISIDQFLSELWLHGYKIVALEEKDNDRTDH